jgi:hypothetical protein
MGVGLQLEGQGRDEVFEGSDGLVGGTCMNTVYEFCMRFVLDTYGVLD